jgi:peptidylprolyl isomerase
MRRSIALLSRGHKGRGWYDNYIKNGQDGFAKYTPPTPFDWSKGNVVRPKAYFDIRVEKEPIGRIIFELAEDIVPKTVNNFLNLCNGTGKYTYKGTKIHNILKGVLMMGGDVENNDGSGSYSSFDQKYFNDENFIIPHTSGGLLSMVSTGIHSNGSQFYISSKATSHLNGRSVVFGRMIEGDNVIKSIEKVCILISLYDI